MSTGARSAYISARTEIEEKFPMLVISGGMPRSGSRWYYRVTYALIVAAGNPDARGLQQLYGKELPPGLTLKPPTYLYRLIRFNRVSTRYDVTFPVKTHTAPELSIKYFLEHKGIKGTYTYRDPRDVIVSALERGREMRETGAAERYYRIGPLKTFARLKTLEGAITWMIWQQIPRWKRWMKCRNVLVSRYEDLRTNTEAEIRRLVDFLELDLDDRQIADVMEEFDYESGDKKPDFRTAGAGRLVNKGVAGRYKDVFTPEQQDFLNAKLGKYILQMGYEL